jgi:hypothetical protein
MFNRNLKTIRRSTTTGFFLAVLIALMVSSCMPDPLEVESVPTAKVEMVVSTQIISDQSLLVLLTRTFGALDASDDSDPGELLQRIAVNDALVTVQGPNGLDTLPAVTNGVYGGVSIPLRIGETYHLKIESAELGTVSATTQVKPTVSFQDLEADLFYNGFNDTLAQITYTLNDAAEKNWYMINVQEVEREDVLENLLNPRAFTVLLPDDEFNGTEYRETFRVFPRDYQPGDTIAVSLSNISEEYYQFMQVRMDNRFSLVEFVSEPVNYPSNVVGGRGYFNLFIPDVQFFVFD